MNIEQQAAIKSCVKSGLFRIKDTEYTTNAYGDAAPKELQSTSGLNALKKVGKT